MPTVNVSSTNSWATTPAMSPRNGGGQPIYQKPLDKGLGPHLLEEAAGSVYTKGKVAVDTNSWGITPALTPKISNQKMETDKNLSLENLGVIQPDTVQQQKTNTGNESWSITPPADLQEKKEELNSEKVEFCEDLGILEDLQLTEKNEIGAPSNDQKKEESGKSTSNVVGDEEDEFGEEELEGPFIFSGEDDVYQPPEELEPNVLEELVKAIGITNGWSSERIAKVQIEQIQISGEKAAASTPDTDSDISSVDFSGMSPGVSVFPVSNKGEDRAVDADNSFNVTPQLKSSVPCSWTNTPVIDGSKDGLIAITVSSQEEEKKAGDEKSHVELKRQSEEAERVAKEAAEQAEAKKLAEEKQRVEFEAIAKGFVENVINVVVAQEKARIEAHAHLMNTVISQAHAFQGKRDQIHQQKVIAKQLAESAVTEVSKRNHAKKAVSEQEIPSAIAFGPQPMTYAQVVAKAEKVTMQETIQLKKAASAVKTAQAQTAVEIVKIPVAKPVQHDAQIQQSQRELSADSEGWILVGSKQDENRLKARVEQELSAQAAKKMEEQNQIAKKQVDIIKKHVKKEKQRARHLVKNFVQEGNARALQVLPSSESRSYAARWRNMVAQRLAQQQTEKVENDRRKANRELAKRRQAVVEAIAKAAVKKQSTVRIAELGRLNELGLVASSVAVANNAHSRKQELSKLKQQGLASKEIARFNKEIQTRREEQETKEIAAETDALLNHALEEKDKRYKQQIFWRLKNTVVSFLKTKIRQLREPGWTTAVGEFFGIYDVQAKFQKAIELDAGLKEVNQLKETTADALRDLGSVVECLLGRKTVTQSTSLSGRWFGSKSETAQKLDEFSKEIAGRLCDFSKPKPSILELWRAPS